MAQALDLHPRAFPHEQFVVIGCDDPWAPKRAVDQEWEGAER
jgi:hypothetical protein